MDQKARLAELRQQRTAFQESSMSSLYEAVQRVANTHGETRRHLVPLLRKYAAGDVTAANLTYDEYVKANAALNKKFNIPSRNPPLSKDQWEKLMGSSQDTDKKACTCPDGGKSAADDGLMGGRTWGNPDPHSTPDDKVPYHKHEDSPPAGADGSAQRKKYNEWFRNNVCPKHKTNCGAPWLAK